MPTSLLPLFKVFWLYNKKVLSKRTRDLVRRLTLDMLATERPLVFELQDVEYRRTKNRVSHLNTGAIDAMAKTARISLTITSMGLRKRIILKTARIVGSGYTARLLTYRTYKAENILY